MSEVWRVCASFPNYEVSDLGRVRRCTPGVNTHVGRIIVGYHDFNGYRCVLLQREAGRSTQKVHRLVVEAFVGPIPDGMQVNHKNGIKDDNRACNLEIATP